MAAPSYTTPTKQRAAFVNAEAGPSRARPAGASPAYSSRRHSLYGIEDRIVIDPGSRCWKVGFSGEVEPRAIFPSIDSDEEDDTEAWDLDLDGIKSSRGDRAEARRLIGIRVLKNLRATYIKYLMTDPKARKVIVIENTFLPAYVKDEIARTLFDDLKVPSISFTPACCLALSACGRITGLVVDCGWLGTTITPVYYSRPLYHLSKSTPLAGRHLHHRLKALLRVHARYYPPPASLSTPTRQAIRPVPREILTDNLIRSITEGGCFVSDPIIESSIDKDMSLPVSPPRTESGEPLEDDEETILRLRERYETKSNASDLRIRLAPLSTEAQNMGPSILVIPGWIRERAAEVLFGHGEDEAENIPELVLQCVRHLPVDLRSTMISSILVVGNTASLPGFIPRIRTSLLTHLTPPSIGPSATHHPDQPSLPPLDTPEYRKLETKAWRRRQDEPYKELYPLKGKLAILNDPSPLDGPDGSGIKGGSAPRWTCGSMAWIGGSLAGALKTGGPEILREDYDQLSQSHSERGQTYRQKLAEVEQARMELEAPSIEVQVQAESGPRQGVKIEDLLPGMAISGVGRKRGWTSEVKLGDWTRTLQT